MSGYRDEQQGYQQYDYDNRGDRGGYSSRSYDRQPSYPSDNGMQKIDDTIYISNLPQDVTEEKLAAHFGSIGIIKTDKKLKKPKIWIYMDKATNLPKGDATLTYDDPPSADAAIDWFGGKEFMGNVIQVSKAERKMPMRAMERGGGGGRGGGRGGFRDQRGRGDRGDRGDRGSGGNRDAREGDWSCQQCGNNNFARRDECFKCQAEKPKGAGGGGGRRDNYSNDRSGGGRDRYDDNRQRDSYGGDRRSGGGRDGRDNYRKDSRNDRRDRPY